MSLRLLLAAVIGVFLLAGCTTPYTSPFVHKTEEELEKMEAMDTLAAHAFVAGNYSLADQRLRPLVAEPTVSRPLYELERVSVLLMQGKRDEAHRLMLKVRADFELLFDPQSEEKALSLWHGENNKVFKGDAHERATLYALLAMSFLELGEWDDAERCVKNGLLSDSANTKEIQYNSDFALLHYLGYVACRKSGRDADASEYAREMRALCTRPGMGLDADKAAAPFNENAPLPNAFLVVWSGTPPTYVRGGEYDEIRHVIPGKNDLTFLSVQTAGGTENIIPRGFGDINFQATTRGGRKMDEVLANKAAVKHGMEASGNILLVAGCACIACMGNDAKQMLIMGSIGGGCLLLGCSFHIVGACINSKADIRAWKNMPGEFLVIPMVIPERNTLAVVRGYKLWDNVACEKCVLSGRKNGIAVKHLSMMRYEGIKNPAEASVSADVKLTKEAFKDQTRKFKGEIIAGENK